MELTIYSDGVAILTDANGRTLWTSDDDDDLAADGFPEVLQYEDGEALAEYLIDSGIVDEDEEIEIVETDDTGLHEIEDVDDDDEDEDDEDGEP